MNTNFHENPSSWGRVVPCGRTDRPSDMTKLIVAFGKFANASKKIGFPNMSLTHVDRQLTPGEAILSVVCNYRKAINGRWRA